MPFQVSPGVNVSEIDLTTVTPAVSSTEGAIAGVFKWGPVDTPVLVDSETTLVSRFGKPTNHNAETFFSAANFLAYGNKLYVARAANTTNATSTNAAWNAIANTSAATTRVTYNITNQDYFDGKTTSDWTSAGSAVFYAAKWPGAVGNSLKVSVCDSAAAYTGAYDLGKTVADQSVAVGGHDSNAAVSFVNANVGSNTITVQVGNALLANAIAQATALKGRLTVGDYIQVGNSSIGRQTMKVNTISAVSNSATANGTGGGLAGFTVTCDTIFSLAANVSSNSYTRFWEYYNQVDRAPGTSAFQSSFGNATAKDELHVVVADQDGDFTGVPGTVLEVFSGLSRASNAKTNDGAVNYYRTVINDGSEYVWSLIDLSTGASNTALNVISSTATTPTTLSFVDGSDGPDEANVVIGDVTRAYDKFASAESVDISLVLAGKARGGTNGEQLANYLIDNVAEVRKDCVVFVSPESADVVRQVGNEATNLTTFRNSLRSSSYAVMDTGYKYQYDKYNDVYRYIPLNGDTAGLCVRTDDTRDPWFSPAGFNRGQIKNIVKLAYNPNKGDRDTLYKAGINPVVTFPGQGTILFGDKTLLATTSAFDRINVRRLFIVLEKAISRAAKTLLFEFNDEFTRAQFKNIVEPFLRDVQGRRGITAFKVVCDETNNPTQVVDSNQFVGDIYIKPAKSINFIQLNFVAVRTGVEFSEIVGQF